MNKTRVEIAIKMFPIEDDSFSKKCEISLVMFYNSYFLFHENWNFKMRWDNDELMCVQISIAKIKKL